MQKIIIFGGSGFIGTLLAERLVREGFQVVIADIHPPRTKANVEFYKVNLLSPITKHDILKSPFAVVNLAGKNIAGRFTKKHCEEIYQTRVNATRHIVRLFEDRLYCPQVLIQGSAIGFYGDRKGEVLDETSSPGSSYLSQVVQDWEEEAHVAKTHGVRTVIIRQANVLGPGGFLSMVIPPHRLGLGNLGDGMQWFSWIHYEDLIELYLRSIIDEHFSGIYNASASPVLYSHFSELVSKILHRPSILKIPQWLLRLRFGSFADEIVASTRVISKRLLARNVHFMHQDIAHALWSLDLK